MGHPLTQEGTTPPLTRRLLAFACAVSAVLFLAAGAAWLVSLLPGKLYAASSHGRLLLFLADTGHDPHMYCLDPASPNYVGGPEGALDWMDRPTHATRGLVLLKDSFARDRYWLLAVPYWQLMPLTGLAPACWLALASRGRRRRRVGQCRRCGYDLTGNTSDRCPECGAVATARGKGLPLPSSAEN